MKVREKTQEVVAPDRKVPEVWKVSIYNLYSQLAAEVIAKTLREFGLTAIAEQLVPPVERE